MSKINDLLDIIAATSVKTIQEAAQRSTEENGEGYDLPERGHITDKMRKNHHDRRRRVGDFDDIDANYVHPTGF